MKHSAALALAFLVLTAGLGSRAQGTFQNLDFEGSLVNQAHPLGIVSAMDALPGWSVFIGTNQQSQVHYSLPSAGAARVTLLNASGSGLNQSIDGGFSVLLQGGLTVTPDGFMPNAVSLRQSGLVPASAQAILFKAQPGFSYLLVTLGERTIPTFAISAGQNYTLFGGDVSMFAGRNVELMFSALPYNNYWNVDSIMFSDFPIPEPCTVALLTLGTGVLMRCARKGRNA